VEARGRGLLLGLELEQPGRGIAEQALAQGFLLNVVQGNVLRFLPPFLLERQHVDSVMELLRRLLIQQGRSVSKREAIAASVS
jgi:acetylornithine/succinyldiaminopimelate/putrescine aminotransferase